MKKITLFTLFTLFYLFLFFNFQAQSGLKNENIYVSQSIENGSEEQSDKWNRALGSFQFQITNSRLHPQVPISTIDLIEKNRLEDKINFIEYKENIKIMILPKSQLKKDYQKLQLFKYITTN